MNNLYKTSVFLMIFSSMLFENSTLVPFAHIIAFLGGLIVFFVSHHRIRLDKITIIMLIFVVISFFYKDYSEGLWSSIGLPQMPISLLICWLVFVMIYNQKDYKYTARCIVVSSIMLSILIIAIVQVDVIHGLHSSAAHDKMIRFGYNSNTVGICTCFGSMFALLLYDKVWYKNLPFLYLTLFSLLSGSRTIILVYLVALFFYLLLHKGKFGYVLLLVIAAFLGVYLMYSVPVLYQTFGVRFDRLIQSITGYVRTKSFATITETRLRMIIIGWDYFLENIWFGNGLASFAQRYSIVNHQAAVYSHCTFIELLCSVGLFGFIIYYARFFVGIFSLLKYRSLKRIPVILGMLLALLFMDISAITYYYKIYYMIFACLILYSRGIINDEVQHGEREKH